MSFPETELQEAKTKTLKKTDIIGLSPKQYVLYRINRASGLDIKEEFLDIKIEDLVMDEPKPGEHCEAVAVVTVTPTDKTDWKGKVNYRVPQIKIEEVYGEEVEIPFEEAKVFAQYNDLARAFLLPPRVYRDVEFIGLNDTTLSYRLDFANPFFKGSLILNVSGIANLSEDKAIVDALLYQSGSDT